MMLMAKAALASTTSVWLAVAVPSSTASNTRTASTRVWFAAPDSSAALAVCRPMSEGRNIFSICEVTTLNSPVSEISS